ncbi:MAG: diguanylate cyclase [Candidatus Omnitrophota bacterium]
MLYAMDMFFQNNLDAVYLVYGLAFFTMGIAIFVTPIRDTRFALARVLWLLAWFGVLHGINEWADALVLMKGRTWAVDIVRLSALFSSFIFLFEFGRQLIRLEMRKYPPRLKRFVERLSWPMTPAISLVIFLLSVPSHDIWQTGAMLVRYFLGFPGCALIAAGFLLYYRYEKEALSGINVEKYFVTAAAAFLTYGTLAGLIVNRGHYFPSTIVNMESFQSVTAIPIQVFRSACAIVIGWSSVGLLNIFNVESLKQLEDEIDRRKLSEAERETLNLELLRSNEKLNRLALEDAHTGLYNYRYLAKAVEAELVRARRNSEPLSVMMMDIDYFKSINDVYGHLFGDLVLQQFARKLKETVRRYDIVARYGGEEFVIVSPGMAMRPAIDLAGRLLKAVNLGQFGDNSHTVKIKVSMAVASYPADRAVKGMDLIERADRILSKAKEQGGNRIYSSEDVDRQEAVSKETGYENAETVILKETVNKLMRRANQGIIESITAFARTIEMKDHYTGKDIERTAAYSVKTAGVLGLSKDETENIRQGAIIHDLGKVGINDSILNKPSVLSEEEFKKVKAHPQIGLDIIRPIHFMRNIAPLIYHHHERWDGKGYPLGLKGLEIPLGARVIAVADVYQALTSDRPYRKAYSAEDALLIIRNGAGTQFDPKVVDAFMRISKSYP